MGIRGVENEITRAILYGEPVNPYNTNLSADIGELPPEKLHELKSRSKKAEPVIRKDKKTQLRGLLNTKRIKTQS